MRRFSPYIFFAALIALGLFLWPPPLMPSPIYKMVYGWQYPKTWQCGSMTVTDYGPGESRLRYVGHFEEIDLSHEKQYSWNLCELPQEKLFFGINVPMEIKRSSVLEKASTKNIVVSANLYDMNKHTLFNYSGRLGEEWFWTSSKDLHAALAYGDTAFISQPEQNYTLEVKVAPLQATSKIMATPTVSGGGWK